MKFTRAQKVSKLALRAIYSIIPERLVRSKPDHVWHRELQRFVRIGETITLETAYIPEIDGPIPSVGTLSDFFKQLKSDEVVSDPCASALRIVRKHKDAAERDFMFEVVAVVSELMDSWPHPESEQKALRDALLRVFRAHTRLLAYEAARNKPMEEA